MASHHPGVDAAPCAAQTKTPNPAANLDIHMKTEPTYTVGQVGFGTNFGAHNEIALEDRVRELIRSNNRLIRVLGRCVKPNNEIASEAHDAVEEAMAMR
jgi:hypothetical protein